MFDAGARFGAFVVKDRHGPNSWDGYRAVHHKRLTDFHGHFLLEDRLAFTRTRDTVFWSGELLCADRIEIHVTKRQSVRERRGRTEVQTTDYSYQVVRREGSSVRQLFRYDNAAHHFGTLVRMVCRDSGPTYGIVGGMEKTTVYMTTAQKRALERAARAEGRSEAELIREGIETVAARHRVAEPTIPLFESGEPDLASRADELLEGFGEG